MPKIVDWDARRDEILSATWRVIARDGIARATIRAIAREAGCSRGILAHYFDDKADILGSALVMSRCRNVERARAIGSYRFLSALFPDAAAQPRAAAALLHSARVVRPADGHREALGVGSSTHAGSLTAAWLTLPVGSDR